MCLLDSETYKDKGKQAEGYKRKAVKLSFIQSNMFSVFPIFISQSSTIAVQLLASFKFHFLQSLFLLQFFSIILPSLQLLLFFSFL